MRIDRYRLLLAVLLSCILLTAGCGRKEGRPDEKTFDIYYTNLGGTRIESRQYKTVAENFEGVLNEILTAFRQPQQPDVTSAMPLAVEINGWTMGINELTVDFNAAYLGLSNTQEVLLRSGLVMTLCQLPDVMRVIFTVDGQELSDDYGQKIGPMTPDSFVIASGKGINSWHYMTIGLYFANEKGDKVVREMRNVYYSSNLITEKVIVEQIIRGPANTKLRPVTVPEVLVQDVKITGNTCIVNLNERFNDAPVSGNAEPEVCLYAFVNSICDACDVEGVRFRIDGSSDVRFRGQVNLDQVFTRNADVIEASGASDPFSEIVLDGDPLKNEAAAGTDTRSSAGAPSAAGGLDRDGSDDETGGRQTEMTVVYSSETKEGGKAPAAQDSPGPGENSGIGVDPSLVGGGGRSQ